MAVDLALAKQHLRVDGDDEDALISAYLSAARAWVENYTGKKLTRGSVEQEAEAFGAYLPLLWGPSVADLSIAYIDTDSAPQTIANAQILGSRAYPPVTGWPSIASDTPITLSYTAGYADVPGDMDAAVLLLVGEFYTNRESGSASPTVVGAVENLCRPYRSVAL